MLEKLALSSAKVPSLRGPAKEQIALLLGQAIEHHELCAAARIEVADKQNLALYEAWQAGIRLNLLKPIIGHGNWTTWLETNFCKKRGVSKDTAELYMRIDAQNEELRDLEAKPERVRVLKFDTIRKYKLGFAPAKEKPQLKGNLTFPRLKCELKFVNEWNRWKRRRDTGQIEKNIAEERRNCREIYDWMKSELYFS